jgi:hypothetical protein
MTEVESNYLIGWCIYLLAVVGMMVVLRHLTSALQWKESVDVIKLCTLVLLLTPAKVDPEQGFWAPAFITVFMEGISQGADVAMIRAWPILIIMVVCLLLSFSWRLYGRKRRAQ